MKPMSFPRGKTSPGNYQVLKSDAGFILSRVELSGIVPISAHENWVGIQKAIDDDEPLFAKGKDAVAMIPQGELKPDSDPTLEAEPETEQEAPEADVSVVKGQGFHRI